MLFQPESVKAGSMGTIAPMNTVKQVSDYLGVSDNTIRRQWSPEFAAFLSPTANPGKGETRQYGEDDIAVLETIAVLRQQQKSYEEIHAALTEGVRLETTEGQRPEKQPETDEKPPETALVTTAFAAALESYENRLTKLEDRLEETTERLINAEKRAAAAEGEIKVLREQQGEEKPRRWFWQR